jgi:serine/threonine protein kinase
MALPAGTRLGAYEIVAPLGAGGMGEVYRARDAKLARDVAIKVLPESLSASPDSLARFEREAKAVAALSHPNILAIFDFGVHEGTSYAVTELLEGETLRARLASGALGVRKAVEIGAQIAQGLATAGSRRSRSTRSRRTATSCSARETTPGFGTSGGCATAAACS